jgi:hypothetical protein
MRKNADPLGQRFFLQNTSACRTIDKVHAYKEELTISKDKP